MAGLLKELGDGLAAFHEDTADYADRLTIVTMSEFGRRIQENGSVDQIFPRYKVTARGLLK